MKHSATSFFKVVVTVPETHAEALRQAVGTAIGRVLGNYSHCSFSVKGIGRFLPLTGAKPVIGSIGNLTEVPEERIEFTVPTDTLDAAIAAIRSVHPYEEPVIDIYALGNNQVSKAECH